VFAALGYKDKRAAAHPTSRFVQFAPNTTAWLDILQLLVQYRASVHEVMTTKTLTTLQYTREDYSTDTIVRFFQLLISESYIDFEVVDEDMARYSAVWNAVKSREAAELALDILAQAGVQFGRIYSDGRTSLHIAAEMAYTVRPLIHLYSQYGVTELNRQDRWGWTPLHYAIMSTSYSTRTSNCEKVKWLLQRGADPHLKGFLANQYHSQLHPSDLLDQPVTPLEYAATFRPGLYHRFLEDLRTTGKWPLDDMGNEKDIFFDAQEDLDEAIHTASVSYMQVSP
jgi:hypothetical protein